MSAPCLVCMRSSFRATVTVTVRISVRALSGVHEIKHSIGVCRQVPISFLQWSPDFCYPEAALLFCSELLANRLMILDQLFWVSMWPTNSLNLLSTAQLEPCDILCSSAIAPLR